MRPLFSSNGVYHMTTDMPEEEGSGEGMDHMISDMKGQEVYAACQQSSRGGEVTMGVRFLFSQFCPLLGTWGFLPW